MQRVLVPELLDTDQGTPDEINASLADLDRINRWFGGVHTTARMLRQVAQRIGSRELSVIDVAGARSQVVACGAKAAGVGVKVTVLDRVASHLPDDNGVTGDALALPFADSSFDVVHCCLFLHHLSEEESIRFLREALRVSRRAVLVNDLRRSRIHLATVRLFTPILFSRITQNDSVASVMRAFQIDELRVIFQRSGASSVHIERTFFFRLAGVLWK
jgi:ubiquinone/menaquinone biosynthesis C-methylase UbiE